MYNFYPVLRQLVPVFLMTCMLLAIKGESAAQQTYTGIRICEEEAIRFPVDDNGDGVIDYIHTEFGILQFCEGSYPNDPSNGCPPIFDSIWQSIPPDCEDNTKHDPANESRITRNIYCTPPWDRNPLAAARFHFWCEKSGKEETRYVPKKNCTRTCNAGSTAASPTMFPNSQCPLNNSCTQFTNVDNGCACEPNTGSFIFRDGGGARASVEDFENCFNMCPEDMVCLSGRCSISPILIDVLGNGFTLTEASTGVNFDLTADGLPERMSWTSASSDEGFLALDRNGNGVVDNGKELFGSVTPQPEPAGGVLRNGFNALQVYDLPENGGNSDGAIDSHDAIFASLLLWQDTNHNGVSEAHELGTLLSFGLESIDLKYKESQRVDEHGNQFRYRAKVGDAKGAKVNRWAWDVFFIHD